MAKTTTQKPRFSKSILTIFAITFVATAFYLIYVSLAATKADLIISTTKQHLGKTYVWGASGPSYFDCSGLVYYVYQYQQGINVGGRRTSRD